MSEQIQGVVKDDEEGRGIGHCQICFGLKHYRDVCHCWIIKNDQIIKKEDKTRMK